MAVTAGDKLTPIEQYLAYVIGLGIALAIVAMMLTGFGTVSTTSTTGMLLAGLALIAIGIAAWMYLVRPWTQFDDLKTPYYTGHEEHAPEHAPEHALVAAPESALQTVEARVPTLHEPVAAEVEARLDEAFAAEPESVLETRVDEALAAGPEAAPPATRARTSEREAAADARDDLTVIEGIGPKVQSTLYAAGITTYRALAESDPDALRAILKDAGLRLLQPDTWPQQAALLSRGDHEGFDALRRALRDSRRG